MGPNDSRKKYFDVAKPPSSPPKSSSAPILNNPKRQMISISDNEKPPEESQPISSTDDDNQPYDDTLMDQPEASEPSASSVSHPDLEIPDDANKDNQPQTVEESNSETKNEIVNNDEDTPFVNPLPGTVEEEEPPEEDAGIKSPDEDESKEAPKEEPKTDKTVGEKVIKPIENSEDIKEDAVEKPESDTPAPLPERFSAIDALPEEKTSEEASQDRQDPTIYDTKEYYVPIGNTHHSHGGLKMAFVFGLLCAVIVVGAIVFYMLKIVN